MLIKFLLSSLMAYLNLKRCSEIELHSRSSSASDNTLLPLYEVFSSHANPHVLFHRFLSSISFDHSVLLDLLIGAETDFLRYFVRYALLSVASVGLIWAPR